MVTWSGLFAVAAVIVVGVLLVGLLLSVLEGIKWS